MKKKKKIGSNFVTILQIAANLGGPCNLELISKQQHITAAYFYRQNGCASFR